MPDIIQLLPDHLANQIAAGEVVQRPASVVKELLENAIDAGASEIQLIIKDAGKELIQVVDNGSGMSPMDARMSFERHATSKIKKIDDLFSIQTMGFRGEALASIAAVAQVELKSRKAEDEAGTHLIIEASEIIKQEAIGTNNGTSIAVKNLFYNVPARRKFLKSNTSEFKHILDEFTHVAMAFPNIAFKLFHNNTEQYHLTSGNLKTRIIDLLGSRSEKNLIPIEQNTELLHIYGFVGKPDMATRTRGNQFIFINNRFIKNAYLNHAISSAYEGLINKESFPLYVLFFDIDPTRVDVNVHPTKQEVKFDDERILYAYLQSAVKQSLAQYNIAPAIDFTLDTSIQQLPSITQPISPQTKTNVENSYLSQSFQQKGNAFFLNKNDDMQRWKEQKEAFFPSFPSEINTISPKVLSAQPLEIENNNPTNTINNIIIWREYLISTLKSGLLMINHKQAMERILYERLQRRSEDTLSVCQKTLFPSIFEVSPIDKSIFEETLPYLKELGFEIDNIGNNSYAINGIPSDFNLGNEHILLEKILDDLKTNIASSKEDYKNKILMTTVKQINKPNDYSREEAKILIDELFACSQPEYTPNGKRIFKILTGEEIHNFF